MTQGITNEVAEKYAEELSEKLSAKLENNEISLEKSLNIMADFLRLVRSAASEKELHDFITGV